MDGRYIIGVDYSGMVDFDQLKLAVDMLEPARVGIDLPDDYLERKRQGFAERLYPLASHLLERGVEVVPLQDPGTWEYGNSLLLAMDMTEKGMHKSLMQIRLGIMKRQAAQHKQPLYGYDIQKARAESAFDIMGMHPTLQEQEDLLDDHTIVEERDILDRALKGSGDLDVVVIGDAHVGRLTKYLPGYEKTKIR